MISNILVVIIEAPYGADFHAYHSCHKINVQAIQKSYLTWDNFAGSVGGMAKKMKPITIKELIAELPQLKVTERQREFIKAILRALLKSALEKKTRL